LLFRPRATAAAHRYFDYQPDTARLKSLSGGHATVSIDRHDVDDFLLPGFFPTRSKIVSSEIELTEENGRWAIDASASATGPQSSCTVPISIR